MCPPLLRSTPPPAALGPPPPPPLFFLFIAETNRCPDDTSVMLPETTWPKSTTTMMSRPGAKSHQWQSLRFDSNNKENGGEGDTGGVTTKKVRSTTR